MNPIGNKKELEFTTNELKNLAYVYLEKYNPSKQQLRTYLLKKYLLKSKKISDKKSLLSLIDSVILSLENNNLINDKIFAESKAKIYLRRGYSINKIKNNLINIGIKSNYIDETISKIKEKEIDPDFFSALKICKKRRIGPAREESNRSLFYKKDIAVLARSGFNYEVSKRVLEITKEEFKKFLSPAR